MGHQILGPETRMGYIVVKRKEYLQKQEVRQTLIESICSDVLELTWSNGVHPGDIAVTCDDYDSETLFGVTEVSELVEILNEKILNT